MNNNSEIAVIGLGAMGLPIANNLAKAGVSTEAWNRSPKIGLDHSIQLRNRLNEVHAPIVLTVLPDIHQVREVLDEGLRKSISEDSILVVMGTVSPEAMRELSSDLAKECIHVLDAPMSGGVKGAVDATMSLMVGGDPKVFERVEPYFKRIGRNIQLFGPVGAGQLAKASNQIIVAVTLAGICEAILLAKRSGLEIEQVINALSDGLAGSKVLDQKRNMLIKEDFTPGGKSRFLIKDLAFALDAASQKNLSLPFTELAQEIYSQMVLHGAGDLDIAAVIKELAREK